MEIANDLVKLGLYDIVIFIGMEISLGINAEIHIADTSLDDSGSMAFEESGERIKDLRLILERVVSVTTLFDEDGISLRFMNANYDKRLIEI